MADRVQANNWNNNLDAALYQYPPLEPTPTPTPTATPKPTQTPIFLPLIVKGWAS